MSSSKNYPLTPHKKQQLSEPNRANPQGLIAEFKEKWPLLVSWATTAALFWIGTNIQDHVLAAWAVAFSFLNLVALSADKDRKRSSDQWKLKFDACEQQKLELEEHIEKSQETYSYRLRLGIAAVLKEIVDGQPNTERINIFKRVSNQDIFTLSSRYCLNEDWDGDGRPEYEADSGCFPLLSQDGSCFVDDLPDPANGEAYFDVLKEQFNIDKKDSKALRMKSRNLVGKALMSSCGNHRLCYVLAESVVVGKLTLGTLETALEGNAGKSLTMLIEAIGPYAPNSVISKLGGV